MKKKTYILLTIFCLLLLYPKESIEGARTGLTLWLYTIVPTLLPFIFITNLFMYYGSFSIVSNILYKPLCKIFHVSRPACYAIITGLLCGFPIGAKATTDLYSARLISKKEATYLLGFTNNLSPAFINAFIANYVLEGHIPFPLIMAIFLSTNIILAYLERHLKFFSTCDDSVSSSYCSINSDTYNANNSFNACITSSIKSLLNIGACIILCSSLGYMITSRITHLHLFKASLLMTIEITSGLNEIHNLAIPPKYLFPIVMFFSTFGGICGILQINSSLGIHKLSVSHYALSKLTSALVSLLLSSIIALSML